MTGQRSRTCLITGCGGFIGSFLAELMAGRGWTVVGTAHRSRKNLESLEEKITVRALDLADREAIRRLVREAQPDAVIHLGGQSYIAPSWEDPVGTFQVNIVGTFHLLEAIREVPGSPVVIVVGSSAEYGHGHGDAPITEDAAFRPASPYGVSKVAQDMLGHMFWRRYGMKVIRARPFALFGPRKDTDAISGFARGIVRVERGEAGAVSVGDLEVIRDFLDVRDGARALAHLVDRGTAGEVYNLCSGTGTRLRDILERLIARAEGPVTVQADPARTRRADVPVLIGDNAKLRRLDWEPEIPLEQTLQDTLEFWRASHGVKWIA